MIIGIAVDDAVPQAAKDRLDLCVVFRQDVLNQGAARRLRDVAQIAANPPRAREVPFELAMSPGVIEPGQSGVDLAQEPAEAMQHFGGARIGFGE